MSLVYRAPNARVQLSKALCSSDLLPWVVKVSCVHFMYLHGHEILVGAVVAWSSKAAWSENLLEPSWKRVGLISSLDLAQMPAERLEDFTLNKYLLRTLVKECAKHITDVPALFTYLPVVME